MEKMEGQTMRSANRHNNFNHSIICFMLTQQHKIQYVKYVVNK